MTSKTKINLSEPSNSSNTTECRNNTKSYDSDNPQLVLFEDIQKNELPHKSSSKNPKKQSLKRGKKPQHFQILKKIVLDGIQYICEKRVHNSQYLLRRCDNSQVIVMSGKQLENFGVAQDIPYHGQYPANIL